MGVTGLCRKTGWGIDLGYCESCAMYWENNGACGNESLYIKRPPQSWCYVETLF